MSQQRALWEADFEEELQDVDVNLAIGSYGQNGLYDDGTPISFTIVPVNIFILVQLNLG